MASNNKNAKNTDTNPEPQLEDEEDEYTTAIGEIGKWQICLFIILAIPVKMALPGLHLNIVFIAPKTTFRCRELFNSTAEVENGTCYSDCVGYEYFSDFEDTIITQWNLICERAWLSNLSQMICMLGTLAGSFVFGYISDRHGRRPAILSSAFLEILSAFTTRFCTNFWLFVTARFLVGVATAGTMFTTFVFLVEVFGPKMRELLGCVYMLPVAIGQIYTAVIAYYFRDWKDISLGVAAPTLIYLVYYVCLPESPKWLISVGRLEEASVVMTTAAKWNKLPTENMLSTVENISRRKITKVTKSKATLMDLMGPKLRMKTLCCCLIWFALGLLLYGSAQYFAQTSSNVFVSFVLMAVAQVPGLIISGFVSKLVGRRFAIIVFFIIAAVACCMLLLGGGWRYFAGAAGVGCISACVSLIYVYTQELFPTVVRSMGTGTAAVLERVGSMLAPFFGSLEAVTPWAPPAVLAAVALVPALTVRHLPETKGKPLDDHIEE